MAGSRPLTLQRGPSDAHLLLGPVRCHAPRNHELLVPSHITHNTPQYQCGSAAAVSLGLRRGRHCPSWRWRRKGNPLALSLSHKAVQVSLQLITKLDKLLVKQASLLDRSGMNLILLIIKKKEKKKYYSKYYAHLMEIIVLHYSTWNTCASIYIYLVLYYVVMTLLKRSALLLTSTS